MRQAMANQDIPAARIAPKFSHLYVEEAAFEYDTTKEILKRYPKATVIPISSYKEVFNRPKQDWRNQKRSQKLILAKREDHYYYKGSHITPHFGFEHYYYNALALNCLYDCDYCYLQGMFPSANLVLFVNTEDYFTATDKLLETHSPCYLCISYDTDLLALESLLPYTSKWFEYVAQRPNLTVELRTKSAHKKLFQTHAPLDNVRLAWTLSPESIIKRYEPGTASLQGRLKALSVALNEGWKVRICIDPILAVPEFAKDYQALVESIASTVDISAVAEFSLGVFRIPGKFLKNIKQQRSDSPLLYHPFEHSGSTATYTTDEEELLLTTVASHLKKAGVTAENIFLQQRPMA